MGERILPNLYRITVPLPDNPLQSINSYVVKSSDRNLIIDTGMNRDECFNAMQVGLRAIGVDLGETDFFITHSHADHMGLVPNLLTENSQVFISQAESDRVATSRSRWEGVVQFALLNGFPENLLEKAIKNHPGFKYGSKGPLVFQTLKDGDEIPIGDYSFKCMATPGHTKGHMCLYEPHKKIFIAGDHILDDITPNIQLWSDEENCLEQYLASLDRVMALDIELVLPGHRRMIKDCTKRIQELKYHHDKRAEEVVEILENGPQDAYHVAAKMSWDIDYDSWDQFPVMQKWFATGEALSHLKYLEEKRMIREEIRNDKKLFLLTQDDNSERSC